MPKKNLRGFCAVSKMLTNELFSSKVKILPTKSITVYNTQTLAKSSYVTFLTFTTLWANSADNKMIIFSLSLPDFDCVGV